MSAVNDPHWTQLEGICHVANYAITKAKTPPNPLVELDLKIAGMIRIFANKPHVADLVATQTQLRSCPTYETGNIYKRILEAAGKRLERLRQERSKKEESDSPFMVKLNQWQGMLKKILARTPFRCISVDGDADICKSNGWAQHAVRIISDVYDPKDPICKSLISDHFFQRIFYRLCQTRRVADVRTAISWGVDVNKTSPIEPPPIYGAVMTDVLKEGDLKKRKKLIYTLVTANADINQQWGEPHQRHALFLDIKNMPLDLAQYLMECGLNVNGVVSKVSRRGDEEFTVTPLSETVAWWNRAKTLEDLEKVVEVVRLLAFNGVKLVPEGKIHAKYLDNLNKLSGDKLIRDNCYQIVHDSNQKLCVTEKEGGYTLNLILRQSLLYSRIFNACLDRKLLIPSPMAEITQSLFQIMCQIDPLRTKDVYSIVGDYAGALGLPRSYLNQHYSERQLLEGIVTHYGKEGKLPNKGTNLSKDDKDKEPIRIEELEDAQLVDTCCVQ